MKFRLEFFVANSGFLLLILFFISSVLTLLLFFIELIIAKKNGIAKYALIIPLACVIGFAGGIAVSKIQINLSKKTAEPIIAALEEYKENTGSYPESLKELTPLYIDRIPTSQMAWFDEPYYYKKEGNNYELSFRSGNEESCFYTGNGNWEIYPQ